MAEEKAKACLERIVALASFAKKMDFPCIKAEAQEALSALAEPVCKTCGGSRKKYILDIRYKTAAYAPPEAITEIPCPACQQQPASELTKRLRAIAKTLAVSRTTAADADVVKKVASFLDAQQQRIEELTKGE